MAQFYTLEEAARVLGMNPEDLKVKAQQREVRAFMDSGSWQFRVADIDELARRRGLGSDPDLSLSDFEQDSVTGSDFDLSEFQLGVTKDGSGIAKSPTTSPSPLSGSGTGQQDILADDMKVPPDPLTSSSSTIIGMEPSGKHPSDSDVRLVPEVGIGRAASDSDVRLASGPFAKGTGIGSSSSDSDVTFAPELKGKSQDKGPAQGQHKSMTPGDSDVSLASDDELSSMQSGSSDDMIPVPDPGATMMRPSPLPSLGSSAELESAEGEDVSDFELSPSNLIDALQPESGSDFELTALDPSDEFESTPTLRPSDSDVTGASPVASGINLGRPSDSGINLQAPGGFDLSQGDSIELMPLDGDEPAPASKAPAKPKKDKADLAATSLPTKKVDLSATALPSKKVDLSATALPTKKVDLSATALPTKKVDLSATSLPMKKEKDIFEDTDFEVDALDASSDDRTVQLDASSDFEIDESDSRTDIFALDEDDVDKNAATALAPALSKDSDSSGDIPASSGAVRSTGASDEMDASWDLGEAASTPSGQAMAASPAGQALAPSPLLASSAPAAEWGGLWVGVIIFSTLVVMITAFVTMDLVNNLYEYRGSTVSSGLVKSIASLFPGGK